MARFTEATVAVASGSDGVRCRFTFEDEEFGGGVELEFIAGPGGHCGHLRASGVVAPLFDQAQLLEWTLQGDEVELPGWTLRDDIPYRFVGLEAEFSFPYQGPFRRLRRVAVCIVDVEMIAALVSGWSHDAVENVMHLPWTLESLTRIAAAQARLLPEVNDVDVENPGQLKLSIADRFHRTNLHNLFANVRAKPAAALDLIAEFIEGIRPVPGEVENCDVVFRVVNAPSPVMMQANIDGAIHEIELSSFAVGPDLSAVFVRDTTRNMAYLRPGEVEGFAKDAEALMRLAAQNLLRSLAIHIRGENNLFMIIAGGNYECSLALVPELWEAIRPLLDGAPVVAMPSRDLCFITIDLPEAIEGLRAHVDSLGDLAYPISPTIYRIEQQGRWLEPVG